MRFNDAALAPGIDVVVTNYRTPIDLTAFLASVYESLDSEKNLLKSLTIANVEPTDGDLDVADAWCRRLNTRADVATTMSFSWNCGYAHACNYGASLGSGGVIALFNADTILSEGLLGACYEALERNPSWAIVGPRQVDATGAVTHAGIFGPDDHPKIRGWKARGDQFKDVRDDCYSVSGSAYFIRRSVWEQLTSCPIYQRSVINHGMSDRLPVGAFLPTPHYYEETWCSVHTRAHGWKIGYLGTATLIHKWHQASPVGGFADKLQAESQRRFRLACADHGIAHD